MSGEKEKKKKIGFSQKEEKKEIKTHSVLSVKP